MQDETPDTLDEAAGSTADEGSAELADLMPRIYDELRHLAHHHMRRESAGHTLQTTAIVHEAYLRLARQKQSVWENRTHFYAIASQMIRRVLVDHARAKRSQKRGGRVTPVSLHGVDAEDRMRSIDILALDEALDELSKLDGRQCRVIELRYFGGLSIDETAEALNISPGTVKGDWRVARAWLRHRLESEPPESPSKAMRE